MVGSQSRLCLLQKGIQLQVEFTLLVLEPREKTLAYASYIGGILGHIILG